MTDKDPTDITLTKEDWEKIKRNVEDEVRGKIINLEIDKQVYEFADKKAKEASKREAKEKKSSKKSETD